MSSYDLQTIAPLASKTYLCKYLELFSIKHTIFAKRLYIFDNELELFTVFFFFLLAEAVSETCVQKKKLLF